jgi:predicted ATPase
MKQFDSFSLDTSNESLSQNGRQIALPPKPFAVLRYLVENPGRLITHDELLDALWPETYVQPQVLRTYVLELRKVLGDDAGRPRFIQTLPKRGYRFVATVSERSGLEGFVAPIASMQSATGAAIVGREKERDRLKAHTQLAATGQRQLVFVTGGAGIGKTALVDAFCRETGISAPAVVACGQCVEGLGKKEDYYPVMEALTQLCSSLAGEQASQTLARMAPAWRPVLGRDLDTAVSSGAPPVSQRTPGDLCGALEDLAREAVLILLLEDLHWADDATLELISALARRRAPAKLMVLATFRPQDASTGHPLRALKQDLLMRHLGAEMALAPLPRIAVGQLLCGRLGQKDLPPGLLSFVFEHSEGNPLFVLALLEHLVAQRFLVREETEEGPRWTQRAPLPEMESGVPNELAQLIELQIERLSPAEQRTLEASSLMSVAFPAWAVAAALERDPAETEEECDDLARRLCFVHRVGHDDLPDGTRSSFYVFAHGLYREVLYQRQSPLRRAKGHTRIADRLGELFAGRETSVAREMAMHFEAAGDWRRSASALRAAAQDALTRRAYPEAAHLLEHAMSIAENLSETGREAAQEEIRGELEIAREALEETRMHGSVSAKV